MSPMVLISLRGSHPALLAQFNQKSLPVSGEKCHWIISRRWASSFVFASSTFAAGTVDMIIAFQTMCSEREMQSCPWFTGDNSKGLQTISSKLTANRRPPAFARVRDLFVGLLAPRVREV